jgi:hypothetical protein
MRLGWSWRRWPGSNSPNSSRVIGRRSPLMSVKARPRQVAAASRLATQPRTASTVSRLKWLSATIHGSGPESESERLA